ncbi:glycosyl transferase family 2 [Mizugakiibacter sediminis]|uniref:Glycosyl transferase family 2 n=1 Tax=Mizugakiibacter sediminis TaxID=1475481 RepID=A0A0K8QP27_9GAMM|nr:glycosyltransferase family 2 protein [Mizugakiibacter sediminis]GAP66630.1 glycosyl transferase family 2 [Mizugakiibacter sediminis]
MSGTKAEDSAQAPTPSRGVGAVIVTYRPDVAALAALIERVRPQVAHLAIVDNASRDAALDALLTRHADDAGIEVLRRQDNLGLAAALNLGIERVRAARCDAVLLLDQDSLPAPDMVTQLAAALVSLRASRRAAAVGPAYRDARTGVAAPFVRIGFPLNRKLHADDAAAVEADFLITSGCLIALDALEAIGPMDARLFIDNVDMEWSFRARARGWRLYGIGAAAMEHRLGDAHRRLPLLGAVAVHGPVRLYYMMRNRVFLYRLPHTPRVWVAQDLPRLCLKLAIFGLLLAPRRANLRAMLRGLADGLRGRLGPYPHT